MVDKRFGLLIRDGMSRLLNGLGEEFHAKSQRRQVKLAKPDVTTRMLKYSRLDSSIQESSRRVSNFAYVRKARNTEENKVHSQPRNCRDCNQVGADNDLIGRLCEDTVHATAC